MENNNSDSMVLQRGKTIGLVMSCVVTQEVQGQTPAERSNTMQSITGRSNDTDTHIGSASVGDAKKAGWKADSVQSVEIRKFYETEVEKCQFIHESFQLDMNEI